MCACACACVCHCEPPLISLQSARARCSHAGCGLRGATQVRPQPVGWPPGHCIFRIETAADPADPAAPTSPGTAGGGGGGGGGSGGAFDGGGHRVFVFSASSVQERARWIAALTRPRRAGASAAASPLPLLPVAEEPGRAAAR